MKDVTRRTGSGRRRRRLAAMGASALAVAALAVGASTAATTAHAATTHTVATAKSRPLTGTYTPPKRNLSVGSKGKDVLALQKRLSALKYYPGAIDGELGGDTQAALWAFQEVNLIPETGTLDAATKKALVHPRTYRSPSYKGKKATRIEVTQAKEILVYFKNNKIWFISHVSSGGGYSYCSKNGCSFAHTPNGTYTTGVFMPGWVHVALGEMYNPVFFISTVYAIHGDTYVPKGPASHGCVRIPMDAAAFFHKMVKTPGTQVHVYGKPQYES
jgi:peptidoglycan hydrolase-like protein with peptidoglycan-binding domain